MKDQIMVRFLATSTEPNDPSGVATYTYCGKTFEHPMPSFSRAKELEQFIEHLLRQARRQAMQAAAASLRGTANALEADS